MMRAAWREMMERGFIGRGGPRGFGRGEGRFGGGSGRFGGPGGGGRMLGHGDLRLLLLALIGEKPRHGYDLIRAVEEKFAGAYAPSPGAVYPTLQMLEEQDLIRAEASEGSKKLFAITAEGQAFLKENDAAVQGILTRIELAAAAFATEATPDSVREAVKTLKQALHMRRGPWTDEEAARVRALIEKTARDILGASGT
jgi:DNA-binding PadR family transcriptional regulator